MRGRVIGGVWVENPARTSVFQRGENLISVYREILVGPQTGFKDMLKFGSMGVPDAIFRHIFWKKSGGLFKS